LELVQAVTLDSDGEELGVENFDIQLLVGKNKQPIPSALINNNDVVEYDEEDLFDLPEVIIKLNATEIQNLLRGVPLKDIFLGRGSQTVVQETVETEATSVAEDIQESISKAGNLFN